MKSAITKTPKFYFLIIKYAKYSLLKISPLQTKTLNKQYYCYLLKHQPDYIIELGFYLSHILNEEILFASKAQFEFKNGAHTKCVSILNSGCNAAPGQKILI